MSDRLQNANPHTTGLQFPVWRKGGKFVIYGNSIFHKDDHGKLTTICTCQPKMIGLSFLGRIAVAPSTGHK